MDPLKPKKDESKSESKAPLPGVLPKIPTLKDTTLSKGKGGGAAALLERLKAFKKKDMAFVAAGMGVLVLAPIAEHFMMSPDKGSRMTPGFSNRQGVFPDGSISDGGTGLAPGGIPGSGSEIITPLNVRDPSALVMGPGASAPQPVTAPAASASSKPSDWKDALSQAASRGAGAAGRAAGAPVPKPALQGGLRGLGAVGGSGGGGGPVSLSPVSASNVPNKAGPSRSLSNITSPLGFKGVAGGGPQVGGSGLEKLRQAAGAAAGEMNKGSPAAGNLESAASQSGFGGGADGGGGPGAGGRGSESKSGGVNTAAKSQSQGESLEFLMRKMRLEKDLELEYKKKEFDMMFWPKIQEKIVTESLSKIAGMGIDATLGPMTDCFKKMITPGDSCFKDDATVYGCSSDSTQHGSWKVPTCGSSAGVGSEESKNAKATPNCFMPSQGGYICTGNSGCPKEQAVATGCTLISGKEKPTVCESDKCQCVSEDGKIAYPVKKDEACSPGYSVEGGSNRSVEGGAGGREIGAPASALPPANVSALTSQCKTLKELRDLKAADAKADAKTGIKGEAAGFKADDVKHINAAANQYTSALENILAANQAMSGSKAGAECAKEGAAASELVQKIGIKEVTVDRTLIAAKQEMGNGLDKMNIANTVAVSPVASQATKLETEREEVLQLAFQAMIDQGKIIDQDIDAKSAELAAWSFSVAGDNEGQVNLTWKDPSKADQAFQQTINEKFKLWLGDWKKASLRSKQVYLDAEGKRSDMAELQDLLLNSTPQPGAELGLAAQALTDSADALRRTGGYDDTKTQIVGALPLQESYLGKISAGLASGEAFSKEGNGEENAVGSSTDEQKRRRKQLEAVRIAIKDSLASTQGDYRDMVERYQKLADLQYRSENGNAKGTACGERNCLSASADALAGLAYGVNGEGGVKQAFKQSPFLRVLPGDGGQASQMHRLDYRIYQPEYSLFQSGKDADKKLDNLLGLLQTNDRLSLVPLVAGTQQGYKKEINTPIVTVLGRNVAVGDQAPVVGDAPARAQKALDGVIQLKNEWAGLGSQNAVAAVTPAAASSTPESEFKASDTSTPVPAPRQSQDANAHPGEAHP